MTTDTELLRRYVENASEEAFQEIVRRHVDFVYGTALRHIGARHRAEDIVQSVFIDLARKAGLLLDRSTIAGWLYVSTCHAAKRIVRAEVRRGARERAAQSIMEASQPTSPEWERTGPFVDDILSNLTAGDRKAVILRFFRQYSFEQLGSELGLSPDAARKRVERALDRIRVRLGRRGVASSVAALSAALSAQGAISCPAGLASSVSAMALTQAATPVGVGILPWIGAHLLTSGVIAIVLAASSGAASLEWLAARRAAADLASARAILATAANQRDSLVKALERARSGASQQAAATSQSAAMRAATANALSSSRDDPKERGRQLMALHPEIRQAFLDYAKAKAASLDHSIERRVGLTPAQFAQFEALELGSTWQWDVGGKLYAFSTGDGDGMSPQIEAEITQLLGPTVFADIQRYAQTYQTRSLSGEIAAAAASAGDPLSDSQAQRLEQILANSGRDGTGSEVIVANLDWGAARTAAQEILSGAQLQVFDAARLQVAFNLALSSQDAHWERSRP